MSNTYRVVIELVGRDKASATLRQVGQATGKAGKKANEAAGSFRNLAGAFTAMLVAQKVTQGMGALVKSAHDFEMSLNRMTVLTGAVGAKLDRMKASAVSAAEKSTFGPQQSAEALIKLTQATGNADVAMAALDSTMGLAMASMGKLTPEKAARMGADLIKAFGAGGDTKADMAAGIRRRFDQVFAITRALGIEVHTFEKIIGRVGQAAVASGQSFEEMFTTMALAARIAPSTLRASNQVLRMMTDMSKKGSEAMDQLGIKTETASGHMRPMTQIFADLTEAYQRNDVAVRKVLFENFSAGAVKPILTTLATLGEHGIRVGDQVLRGADALEHLRRVSQQSGGSVAKGMGVIMNSSVGAATLAKEAWENLKRVLGESLLPAVQLVAMGIKRLTDSFRKFLDLPIVSTINKIIAPIGGALALLATFRMMIWGISQILSVSLVNGLAASVGGISKFSKALWGAVFAQRAWNREQLMQSATGFMGPRSQSPASKLGEQMKGFKGHLIIGAIIAAYTLIQGARAELAEVESHAHKGMVKQLKATGVASTELVGRLKTLRKVGGILGFDWLTGSTAGADFFTRSWVAPMKQYLREAQDAHTAMLQKVVRMVAESKKMKDNFTISSGMLEKSLDKLKDVASARTQVIDVRQMRSIMATLASTKFKTMGDETQRKSALTAGKGILRDLRKMTSGHLEPREYKMLAQKVTSFMANTQDLSTFHRGTISKQAIDRLQKQLVDPTMAAGSVMQARLTQQIIQGRKGLSLTREGKFMPGYDPFMGAFASKDERVRFHKMGDQHPMVQALHQSVAEAMGVDVGGKSKTPVEAMDDVKTTTEFWLKTVVRELSDMKGTLADIELQGQE